MIGIENELNRSLTSAGGHNYSGGNFYSGDTADKTISGDTQHGYLHCKPSGTGIGSGGAKCYRADLGHGGKAIYFAFAWHVPHTGGSNRCKVKIEKSPSGTNPILL